MKISKWKKSKWLTKEDVAKLSEDERRTTVKIILEEQVGGDLKPVIYFKDLEKGWTINSTGIDWLTYPCARKRARISNSFFTNTVY